MHSPTLPPAGGFFLPDGFPRQIYCFTDGRISAEVDRTGGVNTMQVLDVLEFGGKLYPDRSPTPPIVQRRGNNCGKRPLYGPGLLFVSVVGSATCPVGRRLPHFPEAVEIYPAGFRSQSERFGQRLGYDMAIDGLQVFWRLRNAWPNRERLLFILDKDHLSYGALSTMKNQCASEAGWWQGQDADKDIDKPFPSSRKMELTWDFTGFDADRGVFRLSGTMAFPYGTEETHVVVAATRPMTATEDATRLFVAMPWQLDVSEDEIGLCLAVGKNLESTLAAARAGAAEAGVRIDAKFAAAVDYARRAPRLEIAALPAAAEFGRTIAAFELGMLFAETPDQACIRAAAHKFGFFAMWDQISPARAFLAFGDHERAAKLLRYMTDYPHMDRCFWITTQVMAQTAEQVALSGDLGFARGIWPALERIFTVAENHADPTTGLLALPCSSGVDDPKEIGIEGLVWPSCINGWWYDACRAMQNLALLLGDVALAGRAGALADRLAAHYLPALYDPERGYLHAVVEPATGRGTGVYQNVSTLPMDYAWGEDLLHERLTPIAAYQAEALYHPAGRAAVACDDVSHEMWKNVLMFQHLAHEAKIARAAGRADEAHRITGTYMDIFARTKVGIETHNLTLCEGDEHQLANWQAFGARACYGALIEAVVGLHWDLGGLTWQPGDIPGDMRLAGFRCARTTWDIEITGDGPFCAPIEVDGQRLPGTLRVPWPTVCDAGCHRLTVRRSARPWDRPTLLDAVDAAVLEIVSEPDMLAFSVGRPVFTAVKWTTPAEPAVAVDGESQPCDWDADRRLAWARLRLEPGQTVTLR